MKTLVTVYNPGTGEITNSGGVPEGVLDYYIAQGMAVILDVEASLDTHYVQLDPLAVVAYTPEELTAKKEMSKGWIWKMPERIALDQRVLPVARADKVEAINVERDQRIAAFDRFTFNGVVYDGNAAAEDNITVAARGARAGLPLPDGFTWRAFDNSDVAMSNGDILELETAMLEASNLHRYQMHGIARYLKDEAIAATRTVDLDSIRWPE